jgi:hypothetical protein
LSERGRKKTREVRKPREIEITAASVEKVPTQVPRDPSARNDRSPQSDRSA